MIVVLNGYPGVGKLTIGRELARLLSGRLLDIHTVYNLAFALTEFKSDAFKATVEKVEALGHELIGQLPAEVPVVLTTVLAGDDPWGQQEWARMVQLGRSRPPFCVVHVACALDENMRRIQSEGRDQMRKPRDPDYARRNHAGAKLLFGGDEPNLLQLDATGLTPLQSAEAIADWLNTV